MSYIEEQNGLQIGRWVGGWRSGCGNFTYTTWNLLFPCRKCGEMGSHHKFFRERGRHKSIIRKKTLVAML